MFSRWLAAACLILVLSAPRIYAQTDSATRAQHIESEVTKWRSALSLTDEQTMNVRRIMTEQQMELERSQSTVENAPEATRPQLATDLEQHLHSYNDHYDAALDPWQREIARQQGLYDAHVVIVLNWWPWWYHWHPLWHHHHPNSWWHRHHAPFPPRHRMPPPRHPQPPIPPRPGPRFDKHPPSGSTGPRREQPSEPRQNNPRQEKPKDSKPNDNVKPNDGPRREP
jgi:hypothetical protein